MITANLRWLQADPLPHLFAWLRSLRNSFVTQYARRLQRRTNAVVEKSTPRGKAFLDVFALSRKVSVTVVISVRPHVHY